MTLDAALSFLSSAIVGGVLLGFIAVVTRVRG
jgi:hypothetical protein